MFKVNIKEINHKAASQFSLAQWLQFTMGGKPKAQHPALKRVMLLGAVSGTDHLEATTEVMHSQRETATIKVLVQIFGKVGEGATAETTALIRAVVDVPSVAPMGASPEEVQRKLLSEVVWSALSWTATIRGSAVTGYHSISSVDDLLELEDQLESGWFVDIKPPKERKEHVSFRIEAFSLRYSAVPTPE